jgi:hypothetical protein
MSISIFISRSEYGAKFYSKSLGPVLYKLIEPAYWQGSNPTDAEF